MDRRWQKKLGSVSLPLFAIFCLISCGGGSGSATTADGTGSDGNGSASDNPCTALAEELGTTYFQRTPVENMDLLTAWDGYAYHQTHVHNEGVGKWYLYTDDYIEVRAPIDGRICSEVEDGEETIVNGNEVLIDSGLDLHFAGDKWLGYGHIVALKSIKEAFELSGDEGLAVYEGDLLGYTWADGAALDFQVTDQTIDNGLPDGASHVKNWGCPMNYYEDGSTIKNQLLSKWNDITYQPAIASKGEAIEAGIRGATGNSELVPDSCSAINVNTMNHGTIWGNWYNEKGDPEDDSVGTWYHYIRGTVTLLPNSLLNEDTYTVGFDDEAGLWSEMRSNMGVGTPWIGTSEMASIWLPDGVSASDESGCLVISSYSVDNEDAIWIHFELTVVSEGDDLLNLSRTSADNLNDCIDEGAASDPEESFSRYPNS